VALPLDAINKASAREKSIRHGHPSTLHLWWARRPLAAARAVIFAQMVDDPSAYPDLFPTEKKQEKERQRLFRIIEDLVLWENTTNETVLQQARDEIWQSWRRACAENADHPRAKELFNRHSLPAFHDPFAGGGSLPLEAQRLGMESYASDLNPVAVLINKAMIEIPPKFAGKPPVNPEARKDKSLFEKTWKGAQGLAEDVRYYGQWMRDEAEKRIGHLYPKTEITAEMALERKDLKPLVGRNLTVIAWLWVRTVKSPNPAFAQVDVPLASTFMLSTKAGKEAYVEPVIEDDGYRFRVHVGRPRHAEVTARGTRAGKAQDFFCLMSGVPVPRSYVRDEGKAGRLGARLVAVVAQGERGRVYLAPSPSDEAIARGATENPAVEEARTTFLSGSTPTRAMITGGVCSAYGLSTWGDLFTPRQIVALTTFSDLVQDARAKAERDARLSGLTVDCGDHRGGTAGSTAYADAVVLYLAFAVSKAVDRNTALCFWERPMDRLRGTFGRQALPMVWDYAETNPFAGAGGDFYGTARSLCEVLDQLVLSVPAGTACQADARAQSVTDGKVVSSDPPYYDNIGYAELSDFFYVWLRRSLRAIFSGLFATVSTPKADELVATRFRHGSRGEAEKSFLSGMTQAMQRLANQSHPAFPVTIYYAFKQSESDGGDGTASTGWDAFLDAVIRAGFAITGTWPIRTEQLAGLKDKINALASSIVLVCRPRSGEAGTSTRREFIAALKSELPSALTHLQRGNIAPVDLAQAAIGPGMAVFTRYAKVLDAEGKPLSVRDALALINETLDEVLAEQEGDFDADSRWALAWFEQSGFAEGEYGVAETLSKAKNTSVGGLVEAGVLASSRGKVRLLKPGELPTDWDPATDKRLTAWEMVHHLIRVLEASGERAAADLATKLGSKAEVARELAYRLYTVCERKKRAAEALAYNGLVQSWPEITRLAREGGKAQTDQAQLFEQE
jgi:putative DNA methylase